jgi:hypothetical protein
MVSIRPALGIRSPATTNSASPSSNRFLKSEASPALEKQPKVLYYTMGLNKWQGAFSADP